jgi:hypothetical protein
MTEILFVAFILVMLICGGELLVGWISGRIEILVLKNSPLRTALFILGLLSLVAAAVWLTVSEQ